MEIDKLEIDKFIQRVQGMYGRLANLYQNYGSAPLVPEILPQTLVELGSASEIVKLATQELSQQNEELIQTRHLLEAERQRYQDLFEFAPDAYLVTDTLGVIREANRAAAELVNVPQQRLLGKPIINYVGLEDRQSFRSYLFQVQHSKKVSEIVLCCQKRSGEFFEAAMTVGVQRDRQGTPVAIRWLIRDISDRKLPATFFNNDCNLSQGRLKHKYSKAETIPLNPNTIWYVHQGLVKLSTHCETGEEVLIGLAGEDMVFGSSMTALHTYQASAFSNVELVSISLVEISASPTLCTTLFPKINQRLRQTEYFLAISGRKRVKDRFYHLLQLLKREIGEPVAEGTRLKARFTHEDLASACCTTRVTITRLIGKLQQQGTICFDSRHHIIIRE
ncbi:MAG: PAS domain S-box protein [Scytonema sp. PMC 1069.18]|nr:PAS domain S-box protein [Scytonema sp. PMC 1069.18]MEC4885388.1 PAS domain S-box protein [Scytonema sp. PMC 1070.18]